MFVNLLVEHHDLQCRGKENLTNKPLCSTLFQLLYISFKPGLPLALEILENERNFPVRGNSQNFEILSESPEIRELSVSQRKVTEN